jgi:Polyketide cyclase / dehydrase and lipid transport
VGTITTMLFDSSHIATSIDRSAEEVYAFVSDPRNLPLWAAGLAEGSVERVDGEWVVESPMGTVKVAFAAPNDFGVADHDVTLPSGEVVSNPLRVIPNADGCDVVFTVQRRLGVSPAEFAADIDAVTADLATLREFMEQA